MAFQAQAVSCITFHTVKGVLISMKGERHGNACTISYVHFP
jgi:hypothetical protein